MKRHTYFYSRNPIKDKASRGDEIKTNQIPAIEIKGSSKFLMFGTPNINKNGVRYRIKKVENILELDESRRQHIDNICTKYNLKYLANYNGGNGKIPMSELSKEDIIIYEGHNRHEAILRKMESFIRLNYPTTPLEEIKDWSKLRNHKHCNPPLDDRETMEGC